MDSILLIKVISALAYPIGVIAVLRVLRLLFWRLRVFASLLSFLLVVIFVMSSNPQVANYLAGRLEQKHPQQDIQDIVAHDAIIVLGGGIRLPSAPAKHTQIGLGTERLWYAVRLYRNGKANKIILAGGNVFVQPGLRSEAFYASELLQEWGIPRSAILIEPRSRNTQQNKNNIQSLIVKNGISSALLVTSALHMPRAFSIFSELPIAITPASTDILVRDYQRPPVFKWLPSVSAINLTTVSLHEYYGIWVNKLKELVNQAAES